MLLWSRLCRFLGSDWATFSQPNPAPLDRSTFKDSVKVFILTWVLMVSCSARYHSLTRASFSDWISSSVPCRVFSCRHHRHTKSSTPPLKYAKIRVICIYLCLFSIQCSVRYHFWNYTWLIFVAFDTFSFFYQPNTESSSPLERVSCWTCLWRPTPPSRPSGPQWTLVWTDRLRTGQRREEMNQLRADGHTDGLFIDVLSAQPCNDLTAEVII